MLCLVYKAREAIKSKNNPGPVTVGYFERKGKFEWQVAIHLCGVTFPKVTIIVSSVINASKLLVTGI